MSKMILKIHFCILKLETIVVKLAKLYHHHHHNSTDSVKPVAINPYWLSLFVSLLDGIQYPQLMFVFAGWLKLVCACV